MPVLAQDAQLIIPKGHTNPITLIDFHSSEMWLASSQSDNGFTIWNFDAEKELRQMNDHDAPVSALRFHPKHPHILSADNSGRLIITDISKNRKRSDHQAHGAKINDLFITSKGDRFYTISDDSTIKCWNYIDQKLISEIKMKSAVKAFLFLEESEIILVATENQGLILITKDGNQKNLTEFPKNKVLQILHDPSDLNKIILVYESAGLFEIDLRSNEVTNSVQIPLKVKKAQFLNESQLLIVGRGERDYLIFDIVKSEFINESLAIELKKELDPYNISLQTVYVNSDSGFLFIPDYDFSIKCISTKTNEIVRVFTGLTERIHEIKLHPNEYTLGIASSKNGVRLYDLRDVLPTEQLHFESFGNGIDFSPNGKFLAISTSDSLIILSNGRNQKLTRFKLKGTYPFGEGDFLGDNHFMKKDEKDGLTLFDLENGTQKLIKIKEAFRFKYVEDQNIVLIKSGKDKILFYDLALNKLKKGVRCDGIQDFDYDKDNKRLIVLTNTKDSEIQFFDFKGNSSGRYSIAVEKVPEKFMVLEGRNEFITWNTSVRKDQKENAFKISVWDLKTGKLITELKGATSAISSVEFAKRNGFVMASSDDGSIKIWNPDLAENSLFQFPASIIPLDGKDFVVMMKNGIYDASRNAMENLHYVQGTEYISLDQLKEDFYEPYLLPKIFGFNKEPVKSGSAINSFELYPEINLQHPNTNGGILGVDLKERGGGIGDVLIMINGKKAEEISGSSLKSDHVKFKVSEHPFLRPNEINTISVRARNEKGNLISSEKELKYIWNRPENDEESKLYAMVIGVSDYAGNKIDLDFAAKDALDIGEALKRGASNYFGTTNVEVISLTTDNSDINSKPDKKTIEEQLRIIASNVKPQDVFLFYFAGHGVNGKGEDKKYYLLTSDASKADMDNLKDPTAFSISDQELANWLSTISSNNMIMILDACHSGELVNKFDNRISHLSGKEVRALDKLLDETGMYILAGSESEDVSYETSLYGQGLLTYSLLFGMKGEALRDGEYLDVNKLFHYASAKVPQLASSIGGVQQPVVKIPKRLEKIDIGQYGEKEKEGIQLISPRPVIMMPSMQEESLFLDSRNLGILLDKGLKSQSRELDTDFVFLNSVDFSGAYYISGRYSEVSNGILTTVRVFRNGQMIDELSISDQNERDLIEKLSIKVLQIIEDDFSKLN